ncbi:MAG: hypothetical protein ACK5NB_08235 [Flavobacteriaceae bacterium]
MKENKNIDRLFQERFKDFEATPGDAVWKNIEAKLHKKEEKRAIPIWWRFAGAAAVLLLFLLVGINYFKSPNGVQVVDTEQKTNTPSLEEENNAVTTTRSPQTPKENIENGKPTKNFTLEKNKATIANTQTPKTNEKQNTVGTKTQPTTNNQQPTTVALTNTIEKNKQQTINSQNKIAENNQQPTTNNQQLEHNAIAKTDTPNKEKTNKPSIEEAIEQATEIAKTKTDKTPRWSVAPNVAPVYFNSLGEGSSIDAQFNNSPKTGEVNMSYGINASYAVNSKLRIRTGVNKVKLGYNTNDVVVFESASAKTSALKNINMQTSGTFSDVSAISSQNLTAKGKSPTSFLNTSINQSFGFIEVPLELEYAVLDKKLGINVIGGFSSLFLSDNQVFSEFDGGNKTLMGEANNINEVSYSANLGLGFNYKVSKTINFNLEPMFKYQVNTFENTSGDFKPFFVGVYTGFAIKF